MELDREREKEREMLVDLVGLWRASGSVFLWGNCVSRRVGERRIKEIILRPFASQFGRNFGDVQLCAAQ